MGEKFSCPCCGKSTFSEQTPGTDEICRVCGWEDDEFQFDHPTYRGGANRESLIEARANYAQYGWHEAPASR